jgi:GT2 family glycosyltransferase
MISVVVCSNKPTEWDMHRRNVAKTIGAEHEYVLVDNRRGQLGICAAYNQGVGRARGEILVFVHDDVFFMETGWGPILEAKFRDPAVGLVGVAGTKYLFAELLPWYIAGRPFVFGQVVQESGRQQQVAVYSRETADTEVVVADGLFMAIRADLFRYIRFDEITFDQFQCYDLDICMRVRESHRLLVTRDVKVKHLSTGDFGDKWRIYAGRFLEKYAGLLPASCCDSVPDLKNFCAWENFLLTDFFPTIE